MYLIIERVASKMMDKLEAIMHKFVDIMEILAKAEQRKRETN